MIARDESSGLAIVRTVTSLHLVASMQRQAEFVAGLVAADLAPKLRGCSHRDAVDRDDHVVGLQLLRGRHVGGRRS